MGIQELLLLTVGKLIAAVCHGPAGLVKAKGSDGQSLVANREVTGFTNSEEEAVGKTKVLSQRMLICSIR